MFLLFFSGVFLKRLRHKVTAVHANLWSWEQTENVKKQQQQHDVTLLKGHITGM